VKFLCSEHLVACERDIHIVIGKKLDIADLQTFLSKHATSLPQYGYLTLTIVFQKSPVFKDTAGDALLYDAHK
jgi:hypothetical protein